MALQLSVEDTYLQNLAIIASVIDASGDILSAQVGGGELSNQLDGEVLSRNDLQEKVAHAFSRTLPNG